jgi:hypothetical protein
MRRRTTRMLTLRLDLAEDADIIAWLDSIPEGGRSQAVRDVLRGSAQREAGHVESDINLESIRSVVAEELDRALTGQQPREYGAEQPSADIEAEQKYGVKLDQMLGSFQPRNQDGRDD